MPANTQKKTYHKHDIVWCQHIYDNVTISFVKKVNCQSTQNGKIAIRNLLFSVTFEVNKYQLLTKLNNFKFIDETTL